MRVLVTGCEGQLGSALTGRLRERGVPHVGHGSELDVTDVGAVAAALAAAPGGPADVLVNAAAMTHVDRCEREPERARRVNALAPEALARLCVERGVRLVHVSTDYVFDGTGQKPYTEEDPPSPLSVYGRTKWVGEQAVLAASPEFLVVRTSWVFGRGRNFVAAILAQLAEGRPSLRVVDDQTGRPTWAVHLAGGLLELLSAGRRGLYHLANRGVATWWDVARAVCDHAGRTDLPVERIGTAELGLAAPRPRYSVLDCGKAERAGVKLPDWRAALAEYLDSSDAPPSAWRRAAGRGEADHG